MATYTIIPSSLTATEALTNASNAYSDTTSIDCAETYFGYDGSAWLSGFNFPVIPSEETVSSIVVKCKIGSPMDAEMCLYGTSSGTALSQTITPTASAATIYTFTLTESISAVLQYSSTLGIKFIGGFEGYAEIYGAEIIITTTTATNTKTIRLVPSAYWQHASTLTISNIDNAYTNTDSDTYASIRNNNTGYTGQFGIGGFDFSLIPTDAIIDSVKYKIAIKATATDSANLRLVSNYATSSTSGKSSYVNIGNTTKQTKEFTADVDFDTIRSYGSDFGINGQVYNGKGFDLYGVEIEVNYHRNYNKIIYNNKKLIDITSVSVTPEKVAEGYTFHLANGMPAIGSAHVGIYVATASSSSSTNRNLSFTQLEKEPSWFLAVCTSRSARNNGANNVLYNGSSTKVRYNDSSSTATILSSTSYVYFNYSAGTLTIKLKTTPYFGVSDWELYYM